MSVRRIDFYPADYFSGVSGMSAELMGVYWMICTLLYMSDGQIMDTDLRLKNGSGVSSKRLPGVLKQLADLKKIAIRKDGLVTQMKVSNELARAKQRISKAQAAGKQGGRPSKKFNDLEKADGLCQEKPSYIHTSDINQSVSKDTAPDSDSEKTIDVIFFEEIKRLFGPNAGGLGARLRRQYQGDYDKCLMILETAATKLDPREYIGAVLRGDRDIRNADVIAEQKEFYRQIGVQ